MILSTFSSKKKKISSQTLKKKNSLGRSILLLKGFVYGIPQIKFSLALKKIDTIISKNKITTIAWDGDKKTYPNDETRQPASSSYTQLIETLHEKYPYLEFLFFKKKGKGQSLLSGSEIKADEFGNVLGPYSFLNSKNTKLLTQRSRVPRLKKGHHLGVEFDQIDKWYELGLKGYQWVKEKLKISKVSVVIVGVGGVVLKENEKISESPLRFPEREVLEIKIKR